VRGPDGSCCALTVTAHAGAYHDVLPRGAIEALPDMAVAPGAGLPAYPAWRPTLEGLLAGAGPPLLASDYSAEAVHASLACCEAAGLRGLAALGPNPFRCPVPRRDHGSPLPAYASGFLFGRL